MLLVKVAQLLLDFLEPTDLETHAVVLHQFVHEILSLIRLILKNSVLWSNPSVVQSDELTHLKSKSVIVIR